MGKHPPSVIRLVIRQKRCKSAMNENQVAGYVVHLRRLALPEAR